jgi:hypothetical protein
MIIARLVLQWCKLCGRIGRWFLWQEWKPFCDREEFDEAIKRFREEEDYD